MSEVWAEMARVLNILLFFPSRSEPPFVRNQEKMKRKKYSRNLIREFDCQIYNFAKFTINQAAFYSEKILLSENAIKN